MQCSSVLAIPRVQRGCLLLGPHHPHRVDPWVSFSEYLWGEEYLLWAPSRGWKAMGSALTLGVRTPTATSNSSLNHTTHRTFVVASLCSTCQLRSLSSTLARFVTVMIAILIAVVPCRTCFRDLWIPDERLLLFLFFSLTRFLGCAARQLLIFQLRTDTGYFQ